MPHDHPAPAFFLLQAPKNVDHSAIGNAALRHTVHVTVVLVGPTAVGKSGLADAVNRLEGTEGIATVRFGAADVVRHPIVGKIVGSRVSSLSPIA